LPIAKIAPLAGFNHAEVFIRASALKLGATAVTNRNKLKWCDDFAVAALENKVSMEFFGELGLGHLATKRMKYSG